MTQGKSERNHRSLKNQILLESYYLTGSWKRVSPSPSLYYNKGISSQFLWRRSVTALVSTIEAPGEKPLTADGRAN